MTVAYVYTCRDCGNSLELREYENPEEVRCANPECRSDDMILQNDPPTEEPELPFPVQGLESVRERWDMPFLELGMKVDIKGETGRILSSFHKGKSLVVEMDKGQRYICHPQWEITYYDENDTILQEFKMKEEEKGGD